jgi:hypothetical protein
MKTLSVVASLQLCLGVKPVLKRGEYHDQAHYYTSNGPGEGARQGPAQEERDARVTVWTREEIRISLGSKSN